ncbi:MAG: carboxypeptidase-like regulatory domain-containing protein [Balneolaceae bacterium]
MTGKIIDEENEPVAYSHIGIEGSSIGTISDEEGEFNLDISDMSSSDVLVVSSVGYEPQRFNYNQLPIERKFNIVMKKKIYTSDDVDIIALKTKKKTYGSIRIERNSGWNFSGIANGNQIGMIFKNSNNITLSNLNFHVETKGYDSLLYRVNFFEVINEKLVQVNKEDILKLHKISNNIVSLSLDKHDIDFYTNFAVTIEVLKGWQDETAVEQTEIIFIGRNSIQKRMILKSHQFAPIEYYDIILNISVDSFFL